MKFLEAFVAASLIVGLTKAVDGKYNFYLEE
jgi:hypothetical protein